MFASISGLALVVCVTVIVPQGLSLSTIHSSRATGQPSQVTGLRYTGSVAHCLACCSISCWLCPLSVAANRIPLVCCSRRAGAGRRKLLAADFYGSAYDRRYGRREDFMRAGDRTFRDCLNDHFFTT